MDYKKVIKDNGLKQKWIAEQIGITPALLSMYFRGKSGMAPEYVNQLNKILKRYNMEVVGAEQYE